MKTYTGRRTQNGCKITVREDGRRARPLRPRLDLWNHSPTGFEWGYGGSGPAQTALALLADALGDDALAGRLHQGFKWDRIDSLKEATWQMSEAEIVAWAVAQGVV